MLYRAYHLPSSDTDQFVYTPTKSTELRRNNITYLLACLFYVKMRVEFRGVVLGLPVTQLILAMLNYIITWRIQHCRVSKKNFHIQIIRIAASYNLKDVA